MEDVRNDGASSGSCSSKQKVEGFNVVAVWRHEEAMEELGECSERLRGGGDTVAIGRAGQRALGMTVRVPGATYQGRMLRDECGGQEAMVWE